MGSMQGWRQNVEHLVRPEHQHFFDGSQTDLSHFRRSERVAKGKESARHVCHVFPPGQDGRDLIAISLQSHGFD